MKRISDYKGEKAIELWANLLEPMGIILADENVVKSMQDGKSAMQIVSTIFKTHKEEAKQFILAIDDAPIDGSNVFVRFFTAFLDILNSKDFIDFFKNAEQAKTDSGFSGFAMGNTEVKEN